MKYMNKMSFCAQALADADMRNWRKKREAEMAQKKKELDVLKRKYVKIKEKEFKDWKKVYLNAPKGRPKGSSLDIDDLILSQYQILKIKYARHIAGLDRSWSGDEQELKFLRKIFRNLFDLKKIEISKLKRSNANYFKANPYKSESDFAYAFLAMIYGCSIPTIKNRLQKFNTSPELGSKKKRKGSKKHRNK